MSKESWEIKTNLMYHYPVSATCGHRGRCSAGFSNQATSKHQIILDERQLSEQLMFKSPRTFVFSFVKQFGKIQKKTKVLK